tara:strand:+ start:6592 stop:7020 length:429 start_codon:yes stop_codon:yes gene_type:complete
MELETTAPTNAECATAKVAHALYLKRAEESLAKSERIELEEQLSALVGVKSEGSKTSTVGEYKVTTTTRMIRSVDQRSAESLREKYGSEVFALFPVRYSVNAQEFKSLVEMKNTPFGWKEEVVGAVLTKPGKTAVTVERVES